MSGDKETVDPVRANAQELFAKAEAEVAEQERFEPKLPERPFVTGVVSFLFESQTALNCCTFSLWSHVLLNLLYGVFYFADAGMLQIASIALIVFMVMLGLPFALWFSASCLAIARDSANGHETIDNWPGLDITECISVAPYILVSLSMAVLPGYLVGQVFLWSGAPLWVIFATCAATLLFIYPVLLLSMIKSGSPIAMLSPEVLQSLSSLAGTWCRFYLLSGILGGLAALAVWLNWITGFILGLLFAVPMIGIVMVYHRLMGRLAWVIETKSTESEKSSPATSK